MRPDRDPENEDAPEDQSEGVKQPGQRDSSTGYRRKAIGFFAMLSSDIFSNPKIVEAGPHGTLVFVHALCRNAARERTGVLPASDLAPGYVSRQLGISREEANQALLACVRVGLLDVADDTDEIHICGWDESWKRGPLTEAERIRKQSYRDRKRQAEEEKNPRPKKRDKTQTQNRGVRDKSRTGSDGGWGLAPGEPLRPPRSAKETEDAQDLVRAIGRYTGSNYRTHEESDHLVWLMRAKGYPKLHLEALAAHTCDESGSGWASKTNSEGAFYMRRNCTVFGIFSEKNVRQQMSIAVGCVLDGDLDGYTPPDSDKKSYGADLRERLAAFEKSREAKAK